MHSEKVFLITFRHIFLVCETFNVCQITNVLAEERVCGLNTLAALALEENGPASVVKTALVSQVTPLLMDPSAEVRLAAAGALR